MLAITQWALVVTILIIVKMRSDNRKLAQEIEEVNEKLRNIPKASVEYSRFVNVLCHHYNDYCLKPIMQLEEVAGRMRGLEGMDVEYSILTNTISRFSDFSYYTRLGENDCWWFQAFINENLLSDSESTNGSVDYSLKMPAIYSKFKTTINLIDNSTVFQHIEFSNYAYAEYKFGGE